MKKRNRIIMIILAAVLVILVIISAMIGRFSLQPSELWELICGVFTGAGTGNGTAGTVLFQSRLPRIAAAVLIGCGLSVSGASYQGMFRNPMVSPDILGASAGAGFGAALGLLLEMPVAVIQLLAFVFGITAVLTACLISRMIGAQTQSNRMLLVLSGIVTGALFQAFISIIKYVADPFDTMPSISFWLMGGLSYVTASDLIVLAPLVLAGTLVLFLIRWRINLLSFGDDEARAMGVPVRRYQIIVIVCATVITAACVAVGGMIGWVGLVIPHFARLLVGPDYKYLLPCSAVLGGAFLLFVDDIARCTFAQEIPIGILTAIVGAPVFIVLLMKGKKSFI